jgi:hypothetical protein
MSTKQSDEKEGGGFVSTQVCNATKEELLRGEKYDVLDDCPLCAKRGVTLEVGNHRSDQATAQAGGGQGQVDDKYCGLEFSCPETKNVKGWRKEMFRLCSANYGFYENSEKSISYEDSSLKCRVWFKTETNMRSFCDQVMKSHKAFCEPVFCPTLRFGDIDLSLKSVSMSLVAVFEWDYDARKSDSPEQTDADYSCLSGISFASVSAPDVYFRLVEEPSTFIDIKPCGCHIADAALFPQFDRDKDNRLYFSQDLHSLFDGRQTTSGVPHVGVYFVSFEGQETVEFGGAQQQYDKVTIGFETPFDGTWQRIRLKTGSFRSPEGEMHTFVHVHSHLKFKHFLNLKYFKTTNSWETRGVSYNHKIGDVDVDAICTELTNMSVTDAASRNTKIFQCSCGKVCRSEQGLSSHSRAKKCQKSQQCQKSQPKKIIEQKSQQCQKSQPKKMFKCSCGKVCKSQQGLSSHSRSKECQKSQPKKSC